MKITKKRMPIALLCAFLVFLLIYTRPMTLAELCSGIDISECESIQGRCDIAHYPYDPHFEFEIHKEDARFEPLLKLFETRKFRRSLINLLPLNGQSHSPSPDEFRWSAAFYFGDTVLADGSTISGALIKADNFYGKLSFRCMGSTWRCTTSDQDDWLNEVMNLISHA